MFNHFTDYLQRLGLIFVPVQTSQIRNTQIKVRRVNFNLPSNIGSKLYKASYRLDIKGSLLQFKSLMRIEE